MFKKWLKNFCYIILLLSLFYEKLKNPLKIFIVF